MEDKASGFGEKLRRERDKRRVSLEQISRSTKIGTRLLKALEEGQFELLPGGIFNKGFVRSYARFLGLNEDKLVADYLEACDESPLDTRTDSQSVPWESPYNDLAQKKPSTSPVILVLIAVTVTAGGVAGWRVWQQRPSSSSATHARSEPKTTRASTRVLEASSTGSATNANLGVSKSVGTALPYANPNSIASGSSDNILAKPTASFALSSNAGTSSGFDVAVRATDRAWISIKVDGKMVFRGELAADVVKTVRGRDELVLWTGNAGATEVTFNGKRVPIEGGINDVKILVFNSHGLSTRPTSLAPTTVQ